MFDARCKRMSHLQVEHKWDVEAVCKTYNTNVTTGMDSSHVAEAMAK